MKFIPLSGNQHKKLRGSELESYNTKLEEYNVMLTAKRDAEYELSNERLRDRVNELEDRIVALEQK